MCTLASSCAIAAAREHEATQARESNQVVCLRLERVHKEDLCQYFFDHRIYIHDITPFSILVCRVVERVLQKPLGTPPQRIICMRRSSKIMRDLISKIKLMFGGWISLATPQHSMRRDLVMAVGCGHSGNWIQCHRRWLGPLFPVPDAFPSKRLSTHI